MSKQKNKTNEQSLAKPDLKLVPEVSPELLTPEEYEALTRANYAHPESRLILRLFLHVNYYWHVSQYMQGKPSTLGFVDWPALERSASELITSTFAQLLPGVETAPWSTALAENKKKDIRPKARKRA